jgi:hypothetical protein
MTGSGKRICIFCMYPCYLHAHGMASSAWSTSTMCRGGAAGRTQGRAAILALPPEHAKVVLGVGVLPPAIGWKIRRGPGR